jgi:hypothetical protein
MQNMALPQMNNKVCLVVIFNHNFEKNLPILDSLYQGRFSHVRYLMPYYTGHRSDVLSVYDSSYVFQSYIVQAESRLSGEGFTHYVFTGDDVLLNPALNENNIVTEFKATDRAYIREFKPIWDMPNMWWHTLPALRAFKRDRYIEFQAHLPSKQEFDDAFKRFGLTPRTLRRRELLMRMLKIRDRPGVTFENWMYWMVHAGGKTVQYPLVYSYSDFFILPASQMRRFCHLCGIFTSINLFVEIAIPTALLLLSDCITLERDINWRGIEVLDSNERDRLFASYDFSISKVTAAMPANQSYLHPIKLSQLK